MTLPSMNTHNDMLKFNPGVVAVHPGFNINVEIATNFMKKEAPPANSRLPQDLRNPYLPHYPMKAPITTPLLPLMGSGDHMQSP